MNRASLWIPLAVFVLVSGFLFVGFYLEDPHELPSALLDKPLPAFELEKLGSGEVVGTDDMLGEPFLLNVWATWCPTCRAEHGELERIAGQFGVPIYGVNYKDDPAAAVIWLRRYGDPYRFSVVDRDGQLGIDLGVYGAPETFLVDREGMIRYKRVGAVDRRIWETEIAPALAALEGAPEEVLLVAQGDAG
ncbi:MAG: DsbE family thiol:disulfide interchange protein [Pseudomonadales bacterium]|jgi:cytochrome c biogenesis protein CcmG/thiol:disulfide interchange protein DsbE|nr:DsbE family thiol:disulfide interchange protein [Pseudomonadales bacterium]